MNIQAAIEQLGRQFPLRARQAQLPPTVQRLHQLILHTLASQGTAPSRDDMAAVAGTAQLAASLQMLGKQDLVVLDAQQVSVLGAYPLTTEVTPHRLHLGQHDIYAMCALDAISVAPMFDTEVDIVSRCHVSGDPIRIRMRGHEVLAAAPDTVRIGIRWQMPAEVAAHSMCTEMVFLKDLPTAQQWQGAEVKSITLFELRDAIAFGAGFFLPLLKTGASAPSTSHDAGPDR